MPKMRIVLRPPLQVAQQLHRSKELLRVLWAHHRDVLTFGDVHRIERDLPGLKGPRGCESGGGVQHHNNFAVDCALLLAFVSDLPAHLPHHNKKVNHPADSREQVQAQDHSQE